MKWLIDSLASLIFSILLACFVNVSQALIAPVEMDVTLIVKAIPILETIVNALKVLGVCIAVSITLISLKDSIQGPLAGNRAEPPLILGLKLMFALALVMISVPIGEKIIEFAAIPYQSVQAISQSMFGTGAQTSALDEFIKSFSGIMNSMANPDRPNAVVLDSITFGLYSLSDISSIVNNIIAICVLIPIGFELISLCFDVFKRYVFMVLYVYFSPLAVSTLASNKTAPIFKKYCEQVVSNILLTFINVLMLVLILKAGPTIFDAKALTVWSKGTEVVPILQVALFWGLVRFAQTIDRNLAQLINVPSTGEGMGREISGVRHALNTGLRAVNTGRRFARDLRGSGAIGSGGKIGKGEIGSGRSEKKNINITDIPKQINDKLDAVKNTGKNMKAGDVGQLVGNIMNKAVNDRDIVAGISALDGTSLKASDKKQVLNALENSNRMDDFRMALKDKNGNPVLDARGNPTYRSLAQSKNPELARAMTKSLGKEGLSEVKAIPNINSNTVQPTGKVVVNSAGKAIGGEFEAFDKNGFKVNGVSYFTDEGHDKSRIGSNVSFQPAIPNNSQSVSVANRVSLDKLYSEVIGNNVEINPHDHKQIDFANAINNGSYFDDGAQINIENNDRFEVHRNEGRIDVYDDSNKKLYEISAASGQDKANASINGVNAHVKIM